MRKFLGQSMVAIFPTASLLVILLNDVTHGTSMMSNVYFCPYLDGSSASLTHYCLQAERRPESDWDHHLLRRNSCRSCSLLLLNVQGMTHKVVSPNCYHAGPLCQVDATPCSQRGVTSLHDRSSGPVGLLQIAASERTREGTVLDKALRQTDPDPGRCRWPTQDRIQQRCRGLRPCTPSL